MSVETCEATPAVVDGGYGFTDGGQEKFMNGRVKYLVDNGLQPWMTDMVEMMGTYHHRQIDWVYQKQGNAGKSSFTDYCSFKDLAHDIDFDEVNYMRYDAFSNPGRKCYMIDIPRKPTLKIMEGLYWFIESLKNGHVKDGRYKHKRIKFMEPRVIIFANFLPLIGAMSDDRWVYWSIENG
jgi:hypothetical protein